MPKDSDQRATLPKKLDWTNEWQPVKKAGIIHDNLRCRGVWRLPAWFVFSAILFAQSAFLLILSTAYTLGLAGYDILATIFPQYGASLKDKVKSKEL